MSAKPENIKISEFEALLHDCRMTKSELADVLAVHRGTVYQWQGQPPKYALAYLKERKRVLDLQETLATMRKIEAFAKVAKHGE